MDAKAVEEGSDGAKRDAVYVEETVQRRMTVVTIVPIDSLLGGLEGVDYLNYVFLACAGQVVEKVVSAAG